MSQITVKNPHSVYAILKTRPQDIIRLTLPSNIERSGEDAWVQVLELAKAKKIKISHAPHDPDSRRERKANDGGRASIAECLVKAREPVSAEELFSDAKEKREGRGLWIALDCLQDPHNVGAIFRAASFFGVQGILLTQERSAPLTSTVYDVACGGVEYVPHALQVNLQQAFEIAKDSGLWILGTSEHADQSLENIESDRPWLLVLGNEEKGMRRLTTEACDVICQIKPKGHVTSLNVSVAAGILISKLS